MLKQPHQVFFHPLVKMMYRTAGILSIFLLILCLPRGCEDRSCDCLCDAYESEEIFINDTLRLKFNEIYCNPEYGFLIGFDSLTDNRCPLGAVCVWEGNAGITLKLKSKYQRYTYFRLNTHNRFLTDTLVDGLHYELINVLPYPEINKDYSLEDYELLLYISD